MRRKVFSLFLVGVMLFTSVSFTAWAEEEITTGLIYKQDFSGSALQVYDYTNAATGTVTTDTGKYEQKTDDADEVENKNYYGRFITGTKCGGRRIGIPVDDEGITEGKIKVSFRFRPIGLEQDYDNVVSYVGLGHETGAQTNYLALLAINPKHATTANKNRALGVLRSNGWQVPMRDVNNKAALLNEGDKDKWFTYTAEVDLDTRSVDVKVVNEDTKAEYVYEQTGIALTTGSGNAVWDNWPKTTDMTQFVVTGPIDIDDLSINRVLSAQSLTFVAANGEEGSDYSIYTPKARISFNMAVTDVPVDAVTVDGIDCSGGELSADGMTYTFDIPDVLVSGNTYKVKVDTSKLVAELDGVVADNGAEFEFKVEDYKTASTVYNQDFEEGTLNVYDGTGKAALTAGTDVTSKEGAYQRLQNDDGSYYGRFSGSSTYHWHRVGVPVDENGITDGNLNVSFRFRPINQDNASYGRVAFVGLGSETGSQTNYLTLLGIETQGKTDGHSGQMGVLQNNGFTNPIKAADDSNAVLTADDAEQWFTYNAKLNLGERSVGVEVVNEQTNEKYTYTQTNISVNTTTGNGAFANWPMATKLDRFVVMGPIDIDDINISYMPVGVSELVFYNAEGIETSYATNDTAAVAIRFASPVYGYSLESKVTLDGQELSGTLSEDGLEYIAALDESFIVGNTHSLTVAEGVLAVNKKFPPSEYWTSDFTVKDSLLLFEEDYEGDEVALYRDFIGKGGSCTVTGEGKGNHYGKIDSNDWNRGGYSFDEVTSGKLKISFDYMFDDVSNVDDSATGAVSTAFVRLGHEYGSKDRYLKDPLTLLARYHSDMVFANSSNGDSSLCLGPVSAKKWYTYEAILDIDKRTMNLAVSTNNGTMKVFREIPLRENTDTTSATGSGNMWTDWPIVNTFDNLTFVRKINVDNISIRRYYDKPAVSEDSLKLLMADGAEETDMASIDPSVTQLKLDFGERMRLSSLTKEAVSLVDEKGNAVDYVGSLSDDGSIYTLEFGGLKGLTKYTLTVSADVANAVGETMGKDATVSFTTGEGSFSGTIISVRKSNEDITALSALDGGVKVKVQLSNASGKDKTAAVYIAYYGLNNKLVGAIACKPIAVQNGKTVTKELDFELTKPTDAVRADILLWSADDKPLQKSLHLK